MFFFARGVRNDDSLDAEREGREGGESFMRSDLATGRLLARSDRGNLGEGMKESRAFVTLEVRWG